MSNKGENNPNFGGKIQTDDYIKNQILSNSKKKVVVTDIYTKESFDFINSKEAAKFIGCSPSTIREGKRNNYTIKHKYKISDFS